MDPNPKSRVEKDDMALGWKHPFVLYIVGTVLLFLFLLGMGYLAIENDWIPKR